MIELVYKSGYWDKGTGVLSISEGVDLDAYITELTCSLFPLNLLVLLHVLSFQHTDFEILTVIDCRKIRLNWNFLTTGER